MAGRRIHSPDEVNARLRATLDLLDELDPPEHLADLVTATAWNALGYPEHLLPREQVVADIQETLQLVTEGERSEAVQRTLYTGLIAFVSPREHIAGITMPGNAAPATLQ